MKRPRVRVLTALRCEARPVAEALSLDRRTPPRSAPVTELFENESVVLACCGVGKVAMARAVGWLHAELGNVGEAPWLDLGCAGGREIRPGVVAELGQLALAARVIDVATEWANQRLSAAEQRLSVAAATTEQDPPRPRRALPRARSSSLPPQIVRGALEAAIVRTVDSVEIEYEAPGLYDMEASAFVAAARSLSTAELVQVAKVVSDTPDHAVSGLDARRIEELVARRVPEIVGLIERLHVLLPSELATEVPGWIELSSTGRWSFTQKQQLRELLRRWHALRDDPPEPPASEAGEVLAWLRSRLDASAPRLARPEAGSATGGPR